MPGCVMTQALMDLIKKEFPFHKFGLKDKLMNSCRFFLMFISLAETEHQLPLDELIMDQIPGLFTLQLQHWHDGVRLL